MSEMVERVARAIATSLEVSPESWRDHVDEARAAIEAMGEPTRAMIRAGGEITENDGHAEGCWSSMIAEALK